MIDQASDVLGYTFKNPDLLEAALRHASCADHRLDSNERMEFLGDAVLGMVVSDFLYREYPEYLEGELTKIKSNVVSRRVCALVTKQLDLHRMLALGKGMSNRPSVPSSVAAAVFESVIAAIYLDGGIVQARKFILKVMRPIIREAARSTHQENFKSVLQHYAQRFLPCNPTYVLLDEKGPDHAKAFEVAVEVEGKQFGSAWANSKKEAEQNAALNALSEMGMAEVDEEGTVHVREPFAPPK